MKKLLIIALIFLLSGCSKVDLGASSDISATALASKYNSAKEIKAKYAIDGVALKATPKADPRDTIRVTIGDDSGLLGADKEFVSSVKISRWDEVSMKLTPKGLDKIASRDKKVSFEGNKIKYETPKVDYKMYDLPVSKEHEEGAYEIEAVLKEKPATNVVEFNIETQGLDFFYQPALANENPDGSTWEETDGDRSEQPANVVGSYAVYYENGKSGDFSATVGKKNYKAGKMGHIYRPKIIDAKGNWVWGEYNKDLQETKNLTVTVPQDFLDKAVYPVVVDPTFGYTTIAGTSSALTGNTVRISAPWTIAEGGTINEIIVYDYDSTGSGNARAVIYASTTLALIDVGTQDDNDGPGWLVYDLDSQTIAASTSYGIGLWIDATVFSTTRYDAAAGYKLVRDDYTYHATNNPSNPLVVTSYLNDRKYSIYANYSCTSGTCTDTYNAAGTYSWTAPTGVSSVAVACWGAGGSGAGTSGNGYGGGGGAYAASTGIAVTAGNSYVVVVGDGGGGSTGAAESGDDSSFNSTSVVAKGGSNPTGGQASASTGSTKYNGGDGTSSDAGGGGGGAGSGGDGGDASTTFGGSGTAVGGGDGGEGSNGPGNGGNGNPYGGAGGGSSGGAGGNGASGACTITYTISSSAPSSSACFHLGGDWYINQTCYIGSNTSTPGTLYIGTGGILNCIDNAIIEVDKIEATRGTKINLKRGCKIQERTY